MISLKQILLSGSSLYITDKFIDQQFKSIQKRITGKFHQKGYDWVLVTTPAGIKLFAVDQYLNPLSYAWLKPFKDGYTIKTIGVKKQFQGRGLGSTMYDKIVSLGKFYSDLDQTPQARKIWAKLFSKYNVMGYSDKDNKYFKVRLRGNELESADPNYVLYTHNRDENTNRLVVL